MSNVNFLMEECEKDKKTNWLNENESFFIAVQNDRSIGTFLFNETFNAANSMVSI